MTVFLTVLVIALLLATIFACLVVFYLFSWIMYLLVDIADLLHEEKGERLFIKDRQLTNVFNHAAKDIYFTTEPITKEDKK